MEALCFVIIGLLIGMAWASDRQFRHLEDYINDRISAIETEILFKKK